MPAVPSVSPCDNSRFPIVLALLLTSAPAWGYSLSVGSVVAVPGHTVDVPITLGSSATPLAAVVFEIEYDSSKLQFDAEAAKGALRAANTDYAAEAFDAPVTNGRLGVSVYDPASPITTLPDGKLINLRFHVRSDAGGFAYVRVAGSPAPDAANAQGAKIADWNPDSLLSGVFITTARAQLVTSPQQVSFGTVLAGRSVRRELILTNIGNQSATINSVHIAPAGHFEVADPVQFPLILRPQASITIPIRFENDAEGKHTAALLLEGDESLSVPLSASVVADGTFAYETRSLIPAVAALPGAAGTRWRTTLAIMNTGAELASIVTTLISNSGTFSTREIRLAGGEAKFFLDAAREVFDISEISGALIIDSSTPDVEIRTTTVNEHSDGGTIGQSVPVIPWHRLLRSGETAYLAGLEYSEQRRSSIALLNLGDAPVAFKVTLLDREGEIGERTYVLAPHGILQNIDVFEILDGNSRADLIATVQAVDENALFFTYASTVDRRTGGPIFQSPR